MARKGVTYEDISQIANDLKAQGIEPTMLLVQSKSGGSFTTIGNHLAKWRMENTTVVQADEIPPEIQGKAIEIVTSCWNVANIEAKTRFAKELAEERAKNVELKEEIKQLKAALEVVERAQEKTDAAVEEAATELRTLHTALAKKDGELESARRAYTELLNQNKVVKLPAAAAPGKKSAHRQEKANESENKPAADAS